MTSPQNSSIFVSSASSASASSLSQALSHVTTISIAVTYFTPHDVLISLPTSSISPSADPVNIDSRNLRMKDTVAIEWKVVSKWLRDLWKWAAQNVLKGLRKKRESWNW
ncbi:uncharacterized protein MONOS_5268 [Monocercomonoides exilis]|uniref:uncharacterized protein n=1 Tax=Monocercomonoides exilis TaxID=2049356 RepID=UPI00355AA17F|nr:hypothetical protein MONOS_5268 [Monocercomonoides exilis]|eukprot:MONOS_5268.1-p1 / transcript=MONOS_5268.1 / gene=MONOS_5268 / organism=Monocercomonoides_exilis_PA203 / gene_product=unspecified product / transcript_product=unspecified product / location=Mono_scaffold00151:78714-79040(-) / protein_length=109 / sequence_SO=supercontig / SO=protein_coding / is_pseudo=false